MIPPSLKGPPQETPIQGNPAERPRPAGIVAVSFDHELYYNNHPNSSTINALLSPRAGCLEPMLARRRPSRRLIRWLRILEIATLQFNAALLAAISLALTVVTLVRRAVWRRGILLGGRVVVVVRLRVVGAGGVRASRAARVIGHGAVARSPAGAVVGVLAGLAAAARGQAAGGDVSGCDGVKAEEAISLRAQNEEEQEADDEDD